MGIYFGTDGVRGIANEELSPELAFKLGRYGGHVLLNHVDLPEGDKATVLVGRDTRISGQMLESALVAGLMSIGIDVMLVGVITTPAVAYLTRTHKVIAGIMISASHNPVGDNGIKFFDHQGLKLSDDQEAEIEALLEKQDDFARPSSFGLGQMEDYLEAANKYTQFLMSTIPGDLSGMTVTIDAANGAAAPLVNQLFADLETDFYTIGDRPNGLNINEGLGSTHPAKLQETVVANGSQLGLALDGDGDRVIAVDEQGNIIDGDKILYICGKYLHMQGKLQHDTIVSTVMSNIGYYKALEAVGIQSVQTKVGDRYVTEAMRDGGYNLGGEQSGHIVFSEYNTTGDGLLTGVQLMWVMKETGKSLSELASEVVIYPQKLANVPVKDKHGVLNHPAVQAITEAVEAELAGDGRVLLRPSGTEPLFRVMVEAASEEAVDDYCQRIVTVIEEQDL